MLNRLRLKFILVNMTIVTIMLCVIFCVVLFSTRQGLEQESIRMMQMVANNPSRPDRPGEIPEEVRLPFFTLNISHNGHVLATGGGYYDLSDKAFLDDLVNTALSSEHPVDVIPEYNLRFLRSEGPMGSRLVFADISSEQSAIQSLVRNSLLIGAASFFVFLLISIFLARWAVKPVEQAWEQQRRFVADASHELKTPLTVIMTNAELLQSPDYDADAKARCSAAILTVSRQMRSLTESLLDLARVDTGIPKSAFSRLDFSTLVTDATLPFEPVYFEQSLSMLTDITPGILIRGSESHLRQVLDILLDNAGKYSQRPGTVLISLQRDGMRSCILRVANPGAPLSPEDLTNIFKRFYRVDRARTRDGSYGLGLSIAKGLVAGHGGKIWAESVGGVNTFCVQLPAVV